MTLDGVWKEYNDFVAVENIGFTLNPGEFLTLLGPSGSGKTSTLMMVAGFEAPTRGAITVDGTNIVSHPPKERNFGVVFQGYALFPHMTARENVEFPLRMRRVRSAERRRLALEMLDTVGLTSLAERRPREMSGGQQQRVALARALVFRPDALLLDEPLGALDKNMRERMQGEIKALQRSLGISILFVTHDQSEAMTMSDRIAVMDAGRIVQIGTPEEVYYRPLTPFVASFFGETNLLPCEVRKPGGARTLVELQDGATGPALPSRSRAIGDAATTLLSVRPERIRILRGSEEADFVVDAVITECTFLGQQFRVTARSSDSRYVVLANALPEAHGILPGMPVRLGWSGADSQILFSEEAARGP